MEGQFKEMQSLFYEFQDLFRIIATPDIAGRYVAYQWQSLEYGSIQYLYCVSQKGSMESQFKKVIDEGCIFHDVMKEAAAVFIKYKLVGYAKIVYIIKNTKWIMKKLEKWDFNYDGKHDDIEYALNFINSKSEGVTF